MIRLRVEFAGMFGGEHRASTEGADEEVCRVGGPWIGLDILTEKQCGLKITVIKH